jgi:hypothetical protein
MLHITNGHSVGISQTGLPGDVVFWMDVLHEGPTPANLTLEQMSEVRARFISDSGWADGRDVGAEFARRDAQLADHARHEEVVLWFEHDLYDQLQLIQILDWFASRDLGATKLSLICVGEYLGPMKPDRLLSLFPTRHDVTDSELKLARSAWTAFCSPDRSELVRLLSGDTSALPYLEGALTRHLEQFPSRQNGLSRSEQQILEILSSRSCSFGDAFAAAADREQRIFLGDVVFWSYIERMRDCKTPLVAGTRQRLAITPAGQDVLAGRADAIALNGIDRWLGGVHLSGKEASDAHRR